ncbi:lipopolysaccharide ABC transporter permease [Anaerohalosphaera lusitana]|uniref:Lipopolysaccharide ABC transporter permease n=1 Tax=Anaerohalosphaera lusitana TaxID=1936003 RepID=A0A1U9NGI8_9BACT|nr:LptF/LptG family permease [Anaerohalosphaera lusitana]AQT67049.1 lipopolysaccharide ABC transporter permease [Anaerohalosphaera lusitana]
MKILDRYVAKNFLIGYFIVAAVLIGLIIVVDLFVNLDEFAEASDAGAATVLSNIFKFYSAQSAIYFRDTAGFITVIAAVFSLGKMTKNNELIAIMASGVSLKRVIAPIILLAIALTGLLVVDQELIIPRLAPTLVRDHDAIAGNESYDVWFMKDSKDSLICTPNYTEADQTMHQPTFILRKETAPGRWQVTGMINAEKAKYDPENSRWELANGRLIKLHGNLEDINFGQRPEPVRYYSSDITPYEIPLRRQESYKQYLSTSQLTALERFGGPNIKDLAELILQKQTRITDPIINFIMLLIALPVLVCRDPKQMKSAILKSFLITTACFITAIACKMIATEVIFNQVKPELWAWLPVMIFLPVAFLQLDSMRT